MKVIVLLAVILFGLQLNAQQPIKVEVTGNVFNTKADSVILGQYFGDRYVNYIKAKIDKKGNYKLKGTLPAKDYYVLRFGDQRLNIILRDSSRLKVYTDGKNVQTYSNIVGSPESVALNEFISRMAYHNAVKDSALVRFREHPEEEAAINQHFQKEYMAFTTFRQQFISRNMKSPALLVVISSLDTDKDFALYEMVIKQLVAGFSGSPSTDNAVKQFELAKQQKKANEFLASGKPAPDFTQNDVNGNPVSLHDLKGKVVLIDFWASWCGPCRKENPNVVKLYEKYKDAGFTVLSVSLDDNKTNWLAAIEKDKLSWPYHVSDLKKWSNEVARLYRVSGIPFTVLVDAQGNVIDTKLRGPELERALATIFGF